MLTHCPLPVFDVFWLTWDETVREECAFPPATDMAGEVGSTATGRLSD